MAVGTAATYDPYIKTGLDKAQTLIQNQQPAQYTPYTSSAANAPVKTDYYDYTTSAPLQRIQAPNYQLSAGANPTYSGLMGGDYDKLQTALQQPGEIAAKTAYDTGLLSLNNAMGGNGIYGSSIMANQQRDALTTPYMNALATNAAQAAAQRYGMQQTDLQNKNQFGLNLYAQLLGREKAMNEYMQSDVAGQRGQESEFARLAAANADSQNQYNNLRYNADKQYAEQYNNWLNQQNYERNFLYPQAKVAFDAAQQEQLINQALALAGQGAPLSAAQQNAMLKEQEIAAQQAAAQQASQNQLWGSLATGVGYLGNSYMNNYTGKGLLGLSQE